MTKFFAAIILSSLFLSCTDTKKQEKELLDQVIAVHDKVMAKESQMMENKMQLDTMLKKASVPEEKQSIAVTSASLEQTDNAMEDWMHKFDAENKGKSHEAVMAYLSDQKKQIDSIAKQFDAAIAASDNFIKVHKR
ncbi:hypothetical protein A0256_15800 [Mucilaginibacter sp. PAMC 26640]|nr:hypothetical protein A0256_15800 [Mucilaginibacter sp. PAMC 26640]